MQPTPPYEPGTGIMPPLPAQYRAPIPSVRTPNVLPDGDTERDVGGEIYCETYRDRDEIPAIFRREGTTTAYVKQGISAQYPGDTSWYLRGGIDNSCWVPESAKGTAPVPTSIGLIRGGDANPEHFDPAARFVLY